MTTQAALVQATLRHPRLCHFGAAILVASAPCDAEETVARGAVGAPLSLCGSRSTGGCWTVGHLNRRKDDGGGGVAQTGSVAPTDLRLKTTRLGFGTPPRRWRRMKSFWSILLESMMSALN